MSYRFTVPGSPLRKLCRDYYVYEAERSILKRIQEGVVPFQFLQDLVLEFERLRYDAVAEEGTECANREKCYYHQHDDEHPKCL